ncbi:MAG: hypothetical protein NC320_08600 [Clostridium sp.]|nr:hypothetical protein [Clostridium sp.]
MVSMREYFRLIEYTEEFINKIIDYRMHPDKELNRYLSCKEIAEREKCTADDVRKILSSTAIVWNH